MTEQRSKSPLEFGFDAAHYFQHVPDGHIYRRLHGHSFIVEVVVAGAPDPRPASSSTSPSSRQAAAELRGQLDHTPAERRAGPRRAQPGEHRRLGLGAAGPALPRPLPRHRAPPVLPPGLRLQGTAGVIDRTVHLRPAQPRRCGVAWHDAGGGRRRHVRGVARTASSPGCHAGADDGGVRHAGKTERVLVPQRDRGRGRRGRRRQPDRLSRRPVRQRIQTDSRPSASSTSQPVRTLLASAAGTSRRSRSARTARPASRRTPAAGDVRAGARAGISPGEPARVDGQPVALGLYLRLGFVETGQRERAAAPAAPVRRQYARAFPAGLDLRRLTTAATVRSPPAPASAASRRTARSHRSRLGDRPASGRCGRRRECGRTSSLRAAAMPRTARPRRRSE